MPAYMLGEINCKSEGGELMVLEVGTEGLLKNKIATIISNAAMITVSTVTASFSLFINNQVYTNLNSFQLLYASLFPS